MEDGEHPSDAPFVNVNFNIADVRLLHNAVSFYLTDRPVSGARSNEAYSWNSYYGVAV